MVSFWWLVIAFVVGGSAGMLLTALMSMSAGLPQQSHTVSEVNTPFDGDPMGPATQW